MVEYKKILFPVDLSTTSGKIIPHVKKLVETFGAELQVLHVASEQEYYVKKVKDQFVGSEEEPGKSVNAEMKTFKDEYLPDVSESNVEVIVGEADDEILKYIDNNGIDLIVMAIRGRSLLDKAVFGSVAANVARASTVPVFFINPLMDKFIQ
ncbi:MAG: universal stress protein [Desulfobacterales bacterium]|jgi:nucleotide-binding universal stress UspA family protein|nr:universal stress protein [Desulfobacteraceae bacterium]MBT4363989.1 universal stress protein [Desulfobacteraceae bacterium]MBT7086218.1 universal stress protein [Desulfobacterales bacterium]MBT7696928.1 universal stress protein [Desulfobacterales bacterium]